MSHGQKYSDTFFSMIFGILKYFHIFAIHHLSMCVTNDYDSSYAKVISNGSIRGEVNPSIICYPSILILVLLFLVTFPLI